MATEELTPTHSQDPLVPKPPDSMGDDEQQTFISLPFSTKVSYYSF